MGCDSAIYDCATNGSDIPTSMLVFVLAAAIVWVAHIMRANRGLPKD